jgi:MFS family permease
MNALMTIGSFVGAPFLALGDVIGRRGINFLGNAIVILAAVLQAFSTNLAMFMVGRFLLGFGSAMMSSAQVNLPFHFHAHRKGIRCFYCFMRSIEASRITLQAHSGSREQHD